MICSAASAVTVGSGNVFSGPVIASPTAGNRLLYRHNAHQPVPATAPPMAIAVTRRTPEASCTPIRKVASVYPKAMCCTACSSRVNAIPAAPAMTPVTAAAATNRRPGELRQVPVTRGVVRR